MAIISAFYLEWKYRRDIQSENVLRDRDFLHVLYYTTGVRDGLINGFEGDKVTRR